MRRMPAALERGGIGNWAYEEAGGASNSRAHADRRGGEEKGIDRKVGVMLRSLQFHCSIWLFQSSGAREPQYACLTKKEREIR